MESYKNLKILGIESSCDETAMAVLEFKNSKTRVLSNIVSSQVKLHAKFGGVVPMLAAREHEKNLPFVLKRTLKEARIKSIKDIDLIAVTKGPGLAPALLVGIKFAKNLAQEYNKPLIGVNHLEGHIYSNWLKPTREFSILNFKFSKRIFPALNLIVSGGHTELILMRDHGKYELIGETLDDAVGEAFDKVARLLKLGYPGGPIVAQRATKFKVKSLKLKIQDFEFPRPMAYTKDYNFSYSGLKTAVLYKIRDLKKEKIKLTSSVVDKLCYEFQKAAIEVLIRKTIRAAREYKIKSVMLSGGVSANSLLRLNLNTATKEAGIKYSQPPMEYTTDNAAMIAVAGYFNYKKIKTDPGSESVNMDSNLGFEFQKI